MAPSEFNPDEVIDLVSSDIEPSSTKKRPLEDALDSRSSAHDGRGSKRARTDPPAESAVSLSSEEGEIDEEEAEERGSQPFGDQGQEPIPRGTAKAVDKPATKRSKGSKSTAGWNPGISNTIIRTSLSMPASGASVTNDEPASAPSVPTISSAPAVSSIPAASPVPAAPSVPTDPPVYEQDSLSFKLPSFAEKREGSWFKRFKDWVRVFQDNNSEFTGVITPALVQAAYVYYIDNHSRLKIKKRRSAKQASQEMGDTGVLAGFLQAIQTPQPSQLVDEPAKEPSGRRKRSRASIVKEDESSNKINEGSSDSEVEYEPWMAKSEKTADAVPSANEWASLLDDSTQSNGMDQNHSQNGNPVTRKGIPDGIIALDQQRRYFPSASDHTEMCLLCGREGHTATSCPTLTCKFCGTNDHADLSCPSRVRCGKCRQLGHQKSQCSEKLALTKDEGLSCSICCSGDHLEKDCTDEWRSFHPEAATIKKVVFIPASCAACGSNKHFVSDCKPRKGDVPNPTWSIRNRDQYVDPNCGLSAIEEVAGEQGSTGTTRGPELKIRGHAARTHIHYSSDDSDVEFLGKKAIKQQAPLGQIRMASNIQMPQSASRSNGFTPHNLRSRSQTPVQPPLPPGPPPSGPPSRQGSFGHPPPPGVPAYGSRPRGPPPSLPAKPPSSNRDYRNVPPPSHLQDSRGQSWQQNDFDRPRGGQRGGRGGRGARGGRGGGRGRGRGRGK
ncbi:Fc.00g098570.m01.CDS01 [Cosmosporella sp. VM-42]